MATGSSGRNSFKVTVMKKPHPAPMPAPKSTTTTTSHIGIPLVPCTMLLLGRRNPASGLLTAPPLPLETPFAPIPCSSLMALKADGREYFAFTASDRRCTRACAKAAVDATREFPETTMDSKKSDELVDVRAMATEKARVFGSAPSGITVARWPSRNVSMVEVTSASATSDTVVDAAVLMRSAS